MEEVLTRISSTDTRRSRFSGTEWYGHNKYISIGGAGSIGSWTALLLSRTGGHAIYVYDDDTIEAVNLAGQFYRQSDVGLSKVDSLHSLIYDLSGTSISNLRARITDSTTLNGTPVCISAFDNMEARKTMFEEWKRCWIPVRRGYNPLFIDGRMNAENFQVFFVTPDKVNLYEKHLFDDSEVADLPCSYKYTSHTAAMIASVIVNGFTNWIANEKIGGDFRELPFKVTYDLSLMLFEKCSE